MKIGRNEPCPCGSDRKYKNCCLVKNGSTPLYQRLLVALIVLIMAGGVISLLVSMRSIQPGSSSGGRVWSEEHQHWHNAP
jgi:hypothetical protein